MMSENKEARDVFLAVLALTSAEEQNRYLDQACRDKPELRQRVEILLREHQRAGSFLEEPARLSPGPTVVVNAPVTEKAGDSIGRYKLLQQIGEGGCGVVYMAEQEEPIRRRVALKVIKLGMDTKQVIARFEVERQALALMDHPNIAKVLDAGATNTGRPFFVMELVRGIKITDYCDQNHLSTEARLELFIEICHAIQHAHQKGVIHRDIKPSNVLVTLHDGMPVPKVIDFGIAKATDQRLTDKTLFTAFELFIGTPAYMSPEQAEMSGLDIDTRSDIYALGVLLYELLTGRTPFDQKELVAAGLDELRRIIREQEPVRPSTCLSTLAAADQTSVARQRQAEPPQLIHLVRGDLDWIVMRCLEKDRTRRYDTANGLANDIERHLHNEPVAARPPSRAYRFQKLVRRNKLAFAAASAVAAALVIGLGLSTWLFLREQAAHARALAAEKVQTQLRQQAQAEAKKSEQVAQFLKDMLQGVGPSFTRGRDTTMLKEILDKTAERVGRDLKDQPEVEAELRSTLGEVYAALGQYVRAEEMHRAAVKLRTALWGNINTNVADSLDNLGVVLISESRNVEAEPFILESLAIRTNLLGFEHIKVAASLRHMAYIRLWQFRYPESEQIYRQSLAIIRSQAGNENRDVVEALSGLSFTLSSLGRSDEGEAVAREAVAIQARLSPEDQYAWIFEDPQEALGWSLYTAGKLVQAEPFMRERLAQHRGLFGPAHPIIGVDLCQLALVLTDEGKLDEAEATAREGLAISRKTVGDQHWCTGGSLEALGRTLRKAGRLREAEDTYREELAIWHKLEADTPMAQFMGLIGLGQVLQEQGKTAEVEALYRQEVELARRTPGPHATNALAAALASLGDLLRDQDKADQAELLYREGLDLCRKAAPNSAEQRQWLASSLAVVLKTRGRLPEAEAAYREAVTNAVKVWPKDPARWQWQVEDLADVLRSQGKSAEAEQLLAKVLQPAALAQPQSAAAALRTRADLSGRHGKWKEAAAELDKLLEVDASDPYAQLKLAAVLAQAGDKDAYQVHCRKMLALFGGTNEPETLDKTAKACLLVPCTGPNLETASQMAAKALALGQESLWSSFLQLDNGLARYRRGDYAGAVDAMGKVIGQPMNVGRPLPPLERDVAAYAVLAMAQHQLKQTGAARESLAKATDLAETKLPHLGTNDLERDWVDWLIAHIFLREAKTVLGGESTTSGTQTANPALEFNRR